MPKSRKRNVEERGWHRRCAGPVERGDRAGHEGVRESRPREAEIRLKRLLDRAETSTERLLKTVDKEIQAQITSLRRELRDVERRVRDAYGDRQGDSPRTAPAKKAAAKKQTARRPVAKKAARKTAKTSKTVAR